MRFRFPPKTSTWSACATSSTRTASKRSSPSCAPPYIEEPTNWSRRFKANQEKIATGDIVKVAEVVRDLTRRDDLKKLSTGEKRMLTKARGILTSELALARNIEKSAAAERLDAVLAEGRIEVEEDAVEE